MGRSGIRWFFAIRSCLISVVQKRRFRVGDTFYSLRCAADVPWRRWPRACVVLTVRDVDADAITFDAQKQQPHGAREPDGRVHTIRTTTEGFVRYLRTGNRRVL